MITVHDVIRQVLPAGTTVAAGHGGLGHEVTWASRLRPAAPGFGHLGGGELVLLAAGVLELIAWVQRRNHQAYHAHRAWRQEDG